MTIQYDEEDIDALERVSMLIDEYLCCEDDELTSSGKDLKELVSVFFSQWTFNVNKYNENNVFKKSANDLIKALDDANAKSCNSKLQFD